MNCMKEIYGVVLCLFLLASCNGKSQKSSLAINAIDWESKTEAVTPQAVPLPTLCNIEYMQAGDSFILLQNDKMEPCFTLWDLSDSRHYFSFGQIGNGPDDFLTTANLVGGQRSRAFRIWNDNEIRTYLWDGKDSLSCKRQQMNKKILAGGYQRLHALNDTLYCGYKLLPHETGVELLNVASGEIYDRIGVDEGYFEDKSMPYDLTFCVYQDKLVVGRMRFNQIEVYRIDTERMKILPLFVINYKGGSPENPMKDGACYMKQINADDACFYMLNQDTGRPGKETYIDIYTWEGKAVKRLKLDALYLEGVLADGVFYLKKFTDDDNLYRLPVGGGK